MNKFLAALLLCFPLASSAVTPIFAKISGTMGIFVFPIQEPCPKGQLRASFLDISDMELVIGCAKYLEDESMLISYESGTTIVVTKEGKVLSQKSD